ncbi:hypothetical protein PVW48_02425 [Dinoroseobacter sp. PD6]|jgi:hypothetical protein|uniref:hypothetical protein n=2 Tax=Roseobacteraceae TaxID=2854170 RepID=UPI0002EA1668|nr:hypothetical protein [Dinoroseobacter sp. PD6]MDD9715585.1 hypothetical protein [Dinoroseobacter sp. PD6]
MNMGWFLRMARWVRHPPSPGLVKLVFVVIGICAAIYGVELVFGWPESLSPEWPRPPRF